MGPCNNGFILFFKSKSATLINSAISKQAQMDDARQYLEGMGYKVRKELQEAPINLSYQEAMKYTKVFKGLDSDKDGHISIQDLRKALSEMGETVSDDELRALIAEVDINKNCTIEEEEFLQVSVCVCVCVCMCVCVCVRACILDLRLLVIYMYM